MADPPNVPGGEGSRDDVPEVEGPGSAGLPQAPSAAGALVAPTPRTAPAHSTAPATTARPALATVPRIRT